VQVRLTPGPAVDDPALVDTLRDVLLRVGYTGADVAEVLPAVRLGLRAQDLPLYDRQVPSGELLPTLVRLFLLGLPVQEADAAHALAPLELGHMEDAHLLTAASGVVTSLAQLLCVGDLLLFGDRDDAVLDLHVTAGRPQPRTATRGRSSSSTSCATPKEASSKAGLSSGVGSAARTRVHLAW
jgi:hypothetical protein